MKKILVAVDGSKPSTDAARLALELGQALKASVTLAYSVVPLMLPGEVPFTVVSDMMKAEVATGTDVLELMKGELNAEEIQTVLVEGSAAERISQLADEENFDLVVVGSRGQNAVARLLMGSVANRLVHICKKPVLVVR